MLVGHDCFRVKGLGKRDARGSLPLVSQVSYVRLISSILVGVNYIGTAFRGTEKIFAKTQVVAYALATIATPTSRAPESRHAAFYADGRGDSGVLAGRALIRNVAPSSRAALSLACEIEGHTAENEAISAKGAKEAAFLASLTAASIEERILTFKKVSRSRSRYIDLSGGD